MKTTTRNVLIVRGDCTTVSFQTDKSFTDLCREVKRMQADHFYRLDLSNAVFVADATAPAGHMPARYTVLEMVREVA